MYENLQGWCNLGALGDQYYWQRYISKRIVPNMKVTAHVQNGIVVKVV